MTRPTVGLTGGIASGKSTVAGIFAGLGIPVVDANLLAREVVAKGSDGLREVVDCLGEGVLLPDGSLDREGLGAMVFRDPTARARLNAITHPRIAKLSAERLGALADGPHPYVLYEAALLVENGIHLALPALIVVATSPDVQAARVRERDGLSEAEARARIAAQLPLEEKVRAAHHVIDNSGTLVELEARTREVHEALLRQFSETE